MELERGLTTYFCRICGTKCLNLAQFKKLEELPRRGTDSSFVIDEALYLRDLRVIQGFLFPFLSKYQTRLFGR